MIHKGVLVLLLLIIFSHSKVIYEKEKIVVYWILERKQGAEITNGNSFQDLIKTDETQKTTHLEKNSFNQQKRENQSWKTPGMIATISGLSLLFFCFASLHLYKCLLLYF